METSIFKYNDDMGVRIIPLKEDEMTWFVASDVCEILGLDNLSRSLERLDEDEKEKISISLDGKQRRSVWFINEYGIYHLTFSSKREEAVKFRRWITHEVIPSIRRTGKYTDEYIKERDLKINMLIEENEKLKNENIELSSKKKANEKSIDKNERLIKELLKSDYRQMKLEF